MHLPTLLASLLTIVTPALAAQLTISIHANPPILTHPNTLPPTTFATLLGPSGAPLKARLSRYNTLTFPTIGEGSHLLSLFSRDHIFHQYRLDVISSSPVPSEAQIELVQTFRGNEWGNKGPVVASINGTSLEVSVGPIAKKDFYQRREGFNVLGILKSPMILLALVSAGMMFGIPYLLENMDEETKAEFEEAQKKGVLGGFGGGSGEGDKGPSEAASAIQNFDFASWMAGGSKSSGAQSTASKAQSIR